MASSTPSDRSDERAQPSMGGASDGNSGGGNAAGAPDAETAMRIGDPARDADVDADREKLFPGPGKDDKPETR